MQELDTVSPVSTVFGDIGNFCTPIQSRNRVTGFGRRGGSGFVCPNGTEPCKIHGGHGRPDVGCCATHRIGPCPPGCISECYPSGECTCTCPSSGGFHGFGAAGKSQKQTEKCKGGGLGCLYLGCKTKADFNSSADQVAYSKANPVEQWFCWHLDHQPILIFAPLALGAFLLMKK